MRAPEKMWLGPAMVLAALLAAAPPAKCWQQPDPKPQDDKQQQKPADPKKAEQKPADRPADRAAQQDTDSVADAARKAKAGKPDADTSKTEPKKIYTNEDLAAGRNSGGLSVVGSKNAAGSNQNANRNYYAKNSPQYEQFWRSRAQAIRDQMAEVDRQIDEVKSEIKKGGGTGFNVQNGVMNNTVSLEDRNAKLKRLEEQKAELQKQMEQLEDEARKADVPPSWIH